jgi:hypothetical protein
MAKRQSHSGGAQGLLDRTVGRIVAAGWQDDQQRLAVADVLAGLTRLAGAAGGGQAAGPSAAAAANAINEVIRAATRLADLTGDRTALLELISDLNRFAATVGIWQAGSAGAMVSGQPTPRSGHRRADFTVTYSVRKRRDGQEVLFEEREGGRKSFAVTRKDYDAAVAALAELDQPVKFNDLYARFVAHGGSDVQSKYPLRMTLRFWLSGSRPVATKRRARIVAADAIAPKAADAWERAKS